MKRIALSVFTIFALVTVVTTGTRAVFSDTETSVNNTFGAATLDLQVDGEDGDALTARFTADELVPGTSTSGGCTTLKNVGSVDGTVSVEVNNLVSNDNGLEEPEIEAGDTAATQHDPTGYNNNTGNGELWDQITLALCADDGTGSHTGNGVCDWDDTFIKSFSSTQDDYSSYYSIKTGVDLADGKNITLAPDEEVSICAEAKFIDDESNSWWGGQGSLSNNMAMGDDAQFDITFGLVQQ